jgi:exodeoxyribonuclease-3
MIFKTISTTQKKTFKPYYLRRYNICHEAIDIHDPVRNKNVSGFLPQERNLARSVYEIRICRQFCHFNNEPHQYSWWSYRAGARGNKGWRIDYNLVSEEKHKLKEL